MIASIVQLAAVVGAIWALGDDRRTMLLLGLAVSTNASGVLETVHGKPGFLLPLAIAAIVAALVRSRPLPGEPRRQLPPAAYAGPGVVAAVFLVAAIGPFVSDAPSASALAVGGLTKHMIFLVAIVLNGRRPQALRAGLAGFVAGGVAMATLTILQAATGRERSSLAGFGSWTVDELVSLGAVPRAAGPFHGDPNSFAQYLVVAIAAGAGSALVAVERRRRLMWAGSAVWIVVALLLTRSRSGLLAVLLVAFAWMVATQPARRVIQVAAGVVVLALVTPLASFSRLGTISSAATDTSQADTSVVGRASEALAAVQMFLDHPFTGVGFGAYPAQYLDYARAIGLDARFEERSAHSLPLEIMAEQGLIGLLVWGLLVWLVVVTVRRLIRRHADAGVPLALACGGFAASSVFLHDVHPNAMWMLVGSVVGASLWLHRGVPVRPSPPPRALARIPRERLLVAMVIQNYVPALGGAERQLASVAPLLVERGVEPVVITRQMTGRPEQDIVDGVRVVRVPVKGPKPMRSLMFVLGARRALARLQPDVIHAFDTLTPSTVALGHKRRYGTPVAVKLLRSGPLGDLERLARKPGGAERRARLLAEVDSFVVISADIDGELEACGVAPERRRLIPNGVDADRFRPPTKGRRRRKSGLIVIATGRLAPEKRLVELATRWAYVRERVPLARLQIVGEGPEREALSDFMGVELVGMREDVDMLLRAADVYVSASSAEGLSNSLLEAMAASLPCVVTDVGGVRDVIADPRMGVVVDAGDLDRLVEAVIELLSDPDRRRSTGAAARSQVRLGWSLASTADRLVGMYAEMAPRPQVVTSPPALEAASTR